MCRVLLGAALLVASLPAAAATADVTTFYNFAAIGPGGLGGPATPHSNVMQGSDGSFYGASFQGGLNDNGIPGNGGRGTLYRVASNGSSTTLHSFGASGDGASPESTPLEVGGALYGVTPFGGAHNNTGAVFSGSGTIYRTTLAGEYSTLYSFGATATDGVWPLGLILGPDGALYGTTFQGGMYGKSTLFRITTSGAYTQLRSFGGPGDVEYAGLLAVGTDGNFYGLGYGGPYTRGAFLKVTPQGGVTILYAFGGCKGDAELPAALLEGPDGNYYGVSAEGGTGDAGTVFVITPDGTERVLHRFASPKGTTGFSFGPGGNLYGVTYDGGSEDSGTLYMVTPAGEFAELYSFVPEDELFGSDLPGGLLHAADGALYGITQSGGSSGTGTVFRAVISGATTATYPTEISPTCKASERSSGSGALSVTTLLCMMLGLALRLLPTHPRRTP